jgi:hypothetical protein
VTDVMTSWWVGKDRESFNVALKDHTERVMRRPPAAVPPPEPVLPPSAVEPAEEVVETPAVQTCQCERCGTEFELGAGTSGRFCSRACYERKPDKQAAYRRRNVEAGKCARCGQPRQHYKYHCNACQAKKSGDAAERQNYQSWQPGSRGQAPKALRPVLVLAAAFRDQIECSEEGQRDPALAHAAVIMFAGFLFRQRLDWITAWTRYSAAEVRRVAKHLRANGVWMSDGLIACEWMEASVKRIPKRERWKFDLMLWMDAMVGTGELTRETKDGEFYYQLASQR